MSFWNSVDEYSKQGNLSNYLPLGHTISVTLDGPKKRDVTFKLVSFNLDMWLAEDDKQRFRPSAFVCQDLIDVKGMNISNTNDGGWASSDLRAWCHDVFFNVLPDDLRSVIKPVLKYSEGGGDNVYTMDKIWVPSLREVGLMGGSMGYSEFVKLKNRHFVKDVDRPWWLRDACEGDLFYTMNDNGCISLKQANDNSVGYTLGFCV